MPTQITESPIFFINKPWWLPYFTMFVSLFGILFLSWPFQYIIVLFIAEVFLMLVFALIKMVFAKGQLPYEITIFGKIKYLILGIIFGIFLLALSISFTIKFINIKDVLNEGFHIKTQFYFLVFGYSLNLIMNYFANKSYLTANPILELRPYLQVFFILVLLVLTIHLFIAFPTLNEAVYGVVALVLVKFFIDLMFERMRNIK